MYRIEYAEGVEDDLAAVRPFDRNRILDTIEEQLTHQPLKQTRNKKVLQGLEPPWEHLEPVRELRIGDWRVFYDVDEQDSLVVVRAIRRKSPGKTTEDIL
jgi:mRNA-degrading endonuclease RelE of RelBE toxin-antitoxin system